MYKQVNNEIKKEPLKRFINMNKENEFFNHQTHIQEKLNQFIPSQYQIFLQTIKQNQNLRKFQTQRVESQQFQAYIQNQLNIYNLKQKHVFKNITQLSNNNKNTNQRPRVKTLHSTETKENNNESVNLNTATYMLNNSTKENQKFRLQQPKVFIDQNYLLRKKQNILKRMEMERPLAQTLKNKIISQHNSNKELALPILLKNSSSSKKMTFKLKNPYKILQRKQSVQSNKYTKNISQKQISSSLIIKEEETKENLLQVEQDLFVNENQIEQIDQEKIPQKQNYIDNFLQCNEDLSQQYQFQTIQEWKNSIQAEQDIDDQYDDLSQNKHIYFVDLQIVFHNQSYITWVMRAILVDWISEVCDELKFMKNTFYLAVNYIDRFLNVNCNIKKQDLQLIGVTCIFIASKFEEVQVISLDNIVKTSDYLYTNLQIIQMEQKILTVNLQILIYKKSLQWRLNPITIYQLTNYYVQKWNKFNKLNQTQFDGLFQLIDCTLLHIRTSYFDPFHIIAGLLYLFSGVQYSSFDINTYKIKPISMFKNFISKKDNFHEIYDDFCKQYFKFSLHMIEKVIIFLLKFFEMRFQKDGLDQNLQQHQKYALDFVKNKIKLGN